MSTDQQCVTRCPAGSFGSKETWQCEACPQGCAQCQDEQRCTRCLSTRKSALYLQNGQCLRQCTRLKADFHSIFVKEMDIFSARSVCIWNSDWIQLPLAYSLYHHCYTQMLILCINPFSDKCIYVYQLCVGVICFTEATTLQEPCVRAVHQVVHRVSKVPQTVSAVSNHQCFTITSV